MQDDSKAVAVAAPSAFDAEVSLDEYFALMLQNAADRFPDAGIMVLITNDAKDGELTSLSNMCPDEAAYVLEMALTGHEDEAPLRTANLTRH